MGKKEKETKETSTPIFSKLIKDTVIDLKSDFPVSVYADCAGQVISKIKEKNTNNTPINIFNVYLCKSTYTSEVDEKYGTCEISSTLEDENTEVITMKLFADSILSYKADPVKLVSLSKLISDIFHKLSTVMFDDQEVLQELQKRDTYVVFHTGDSEQILGTLVGSAIGCMISNSVNDIISMGVPINFVSPVMVAYSEPQGLYLFDNESSLYDDEKKKKKKKDKKKKNKK